MKKLYTIILILLGSISIAQPSINIGTDLKVGIFGTDNQYTTHDPIFNYEIKFEFQHDDTYMAVGHKYVNLSEKYVSFYFNLGHTFNLTGNCNGRNNIILIPQFEIGHLMRIDERTDSIPGVIYPQINLSARYRFNDNFAVGFKPYVQLSRDISRTFRYGGNIEIILL
jgi:hypothetical protein